MTCGSMSRLFSSETTCTHGSTEKYNLVMRGFGGDWNHPLKYMFDRTNLGNKYGTTLHCINSCIIKLGKLLQPGTQLYRGLSGLLPRRFLQSKVRGGVEMAFMSTTKNRDVAFEYARSGGSAAPIVFQLTTGLIDRGADLQWLSQYPHEEEMCGYIGT